MFQMFVCGAPVCRQGYIATNNALCSASNMKGKTCCSVPCSFCVVTLCQRLLFSMPPSSIVMKTLSLFARFTSKRAVAYERSPPFCDHPAHLHFGLILIVQIYDT